ncbi:MAG: amidase [Actinobacteria bacterium]|nr:amidase [Actinomycetota bacterium]
MLGVDPTALGAADLSLAIHSREVSCLEVMAAFLDRIELRNPSVNAIVSLRDRDELMTEAAECDEEIAADLSRGWMHGMPQAIKDLAGTRGLRTTMGSPLFADHVPERDDLMVARMRRAGCLIVGKTNVPEFGKGSHTFNEVFGPTRNPYDLGRTAGGSSGGAAVALATRMLPVADGSDYMGSLRNPAAWNNVFGFRPSQGRVPAWPSTDQYLSQMGTEGPMGRSVIDVAMLLGTQAGHDPRVPLSLDGRLTEFADIDTARRTLDVDPEGTRVGWLGDLGGHLALEPGIEAVCVDGLARLAELGCTVEAVGVDFPLDDLWDAWLTWRHMVVVSGIGASVNDGNRHLVKPEILWEIDQGHALTLERVNRAATIRTRYHEAMAGLFLHFDALVLPTAQVWPFPVEERWPTHIGTREMDTYHRWMEVTLYATFAGLPSISVPVGFDERGLPMGMQLIGAPRADVEVLALAHAYERTIGHLAIGEA